ncbi:MAG: hypothetical protein WDN48_15570 [Pseudolabrys sp.]
MDAAPIIYEPRRKWDLRTVLTIHVPGNICLRGTMMKFGEAVCNGLIDERVCGACWVEGRGMPKLFAQPFAALPLGIAKRVRRFDSRMAIALAARALGAGMREQFAEMVKNADRIVAVCQWLYDALVANGVPTNKLILSRQGISPGLFSVDPMDEMARSSDTGSLKLLYLGRCRPIKGIDVLVRAVRSIAADRSITLTICAKPASAEEHEYESICVCSRRAIQGSSLVSPFLEIRLRMSWHAMTCWRCLPYGSKLVPWSFSRRKLLASLYSVQISAELQN